MAARDKSKNELLIISRVLKTQYYNDFVVPLAVSTKRNFKPMSEGDPTGLCPFHKDTDPSFHAWKGREVFKCFGCGSSGDVVRIHQMMHRAYFGSSITVERAIEQLAQKYEIELDRETGHIVKSPFDRAKELLFHKETYVIPKGVFSLAEFRQLNNRVKRTNLPMKDKVVNFEHLDAVASVAMSNH
jgi:hypothetical protein